MNLERKILVFNIKRFAVHDGPGIRTTVFLKGCSLHCPWCQNPEGISEIRNLLYNKNKCIQCHQCISICPEGAITKNEENYISINKNNCNLCGDCVEICPSRAIQFDSREWTISNLVLELLKDKVFFEESNGGITFSGGEPLLQAENILGIATKLKNYDIHIAAETALMVPETALKRVINFIDLFIIDIKLMDKIDAKKTIGLDLNLYNKNLEYLFANDADLLFRMPLIPGHTNSEANFSAARNLIKYFNKKYKRDLLIEPVNFNPLIKSKYLQLDKTLPSVNSWKKFTQNEMQYFYTKLNHE